MALTSNRVILRIPTIPSKLLDYLHNQHHSALVGMEISGSYYTAQNKLLFANGSSRYVDYDMACELTSNLSIQGMNFIEFDDYALFREWEYYADRRAVHDSQYQVAPMHYSSFDSFIGPAGSTTSSTSTTITPRVSAKEKKEEELKEKKKEAHRKVYWNRVHKKLKKWIQKVRERDG